MKTFQKFAPFLVAKLLFILTAVGPLQASFEIGFSGKYAEPTLTYSNANLNANIGAFHPKVFTRFCFLLSPTLRFGFGPNFEMGKLSGLSFWGNTGSFTFMAYGADAQFTFLLNEVLVPYLKAGASYVNGVHARSKTGQSRYFIAPLSGLKYTAGLGATLMPLGVFSLYAEAGYFFGELTGDATVNSYSYWTSKWTTKEYVSEKVKYSGYYAEVGVVFGFGRQKEIDKAYERLDEQRENSSSKTNRDDFGEDDFGENDTNEPNDEEDDSLSDIF